MDAAQLGQTALETLQWGICIFCLREVYRIAQAVSRILGALSGEVD